MSIVFPRLSTRPVRVLLASLVFAGAAFTGGTAAAQDFPTFKGDNARTGKSSNANASGPGRGTLRWFHPFGQQQPQRIIVDDTQAIPGGGVGWFGPAPENEASFPYLVRDADGNHASPAYRYTMATPSAPNTGAGPRPTVPAVPADHRVFEWQLQVPPGESRPVSVHAWLPIGPTRVGGTQRFTQRYFVYEVIYGTGPQDRYVDVVDTFAAGAGWFRIGGGGRPTDRLFPSPVSGLITLRLHNTVPRNEAGQLLEAAPVEQFLVYADAAMAVTEYGFAHATPTIASLLGGPPMTISAVNEVSVDRDPNGVLNTFAQGIVRAVDTPTATELWRHTPAVDDERTRMQDNTSVGVVVTGTHFSVSTASGRFIGTDYFEAPLLALRLPSTVEYSPNLEDDQRYDVYVYLSGDAAGELFGRHVVYEIWEGPTKHEVVVNQADQRGWVRIGGRTFRHTDLQPLRVVLTNNSRNPDVDTGRKAYADAVRFVGPGNRSITSTPLQTRALIRLEPGGDPVERDLVLVASEDGKIHALDRQGLGDGTTVEYWTYPSTRDVENPNWTDPNHVAGLDGQGGIAEAPTNFDLSSALVQRINGEDILFIGATNGRVYAINMAGRGDHDLARRHPGTTERRWTFPNDYPANNRVPSRLGRIATPAFTVTANGPTLLVPTEQGRMYALNALGNNAAKTTNAYWTYPALTEPTLGRMMTAPAVEFGRVYVGTTRHDERPGQLLALNVDNGQPVWTIDPAVAQAFDSFLASPTTVPAALLNSLDLAGEVTMPNTVYALNENRVLYAFNADTGDLLWQTNELNSGAIGALGYTSMIVYDRNAVLRHVPVVVVPTRDGRFTALFARGTPNVPTGDSITNVFGRKRAWGYFAAAPLMASIATGNGWLIGADEEANTYAFSNASPGTPILTPGVPPGQEIIVENDPAGAAFRLARVRLLTRTGYNLLRQPRTIPPGIPNPTFPTYNEAVNLHSFIRDPLAFEWGETAYILVHDFPYLTMNSVGTPVPPPVVNVQLSVEGRPHRQLAMEARQFQTGDPTVPTAPTGERLDGYAVLAFPFQGGGPNAVPPGSGTIKVTISTAALGSGQGQQNIALNPDLAELPFFVANPIGIAMNLVSGTPNAMAVTTQTDHPEALVNGNPNLPGSPRDESRVGTSFGRTSHGQANRNQIYVYDRSLMTLLRGPGRGLDGVRVDRRDLAWNTTMSPVKPLSQVLYPNFEDLPGQFPNISVDYPDIRRDTVNVVKDPQGAVENPVYGPISLKPPFAVDGSGNAVPVTEANAADRRLDPTPFELQIEVPRFQPANLGTYLDAANASRDGGYVGRFSVFVDSTQNGQLDVAQREAYRSFLLGVGVPVDARMAVLTPTVDLGLLAGGTGYTHNPATNPFSPWVGNYRELFREFRVANEGNVNLLNVRLAKSTSLNPWRIFSVGGDEMSWLDARLDVWSTIDQNFAPQRAPGNPAAENVFVQKARVGDRHATELSVNPARRPNPNLNITDVNLLPGGPVPGPAKVAATIPIGFPVGPYSQLMRVIEDEIGNDESLQMAPNGTPLEPYSDPGFTLNFNVRETRLTTSWTRRTSPMADDLVPASEGNPHAYGNMQPSGFRDTNGNVFFAWASNRPAYEPAQATSPTVDLPWRIFLAGLDGTRPDGNDQSSLQDLNRFAPGSGARWFKHHDEILPTTDPNVLFGPLQAGESLVAGTATYGSPSFPTQGLMQPFGSNAFGNLYLGFVGEAQKQTPTGRILESRLFLTQVTPNQDATISVTPPVVLRDNPQIRKGRPSIVQTAPLVANGPAAYVFYGGTASGRTTIYTTEFRPGSGFSTPRPLTFGTGWDSATSPSAVGRVYRGAQWAQTPMIDLTFSGRLRGMPAAEIFRGRMRISADGTLGNFEHMGLQTDERLIGVETGVFRAQGVDWARDPIDSNANPPRLEFFELHQVLNGNRQNLLVPDTRNVDRQTGVVTYRTILGGQVYIDPNLGTVRFGTAVPARASELLLTYRPRFQRMSEGGGTGYVGPTMLFDTRAASSVSYWRRADHTNPLPSDTFPLDRMVVTYGRSAAGAGQASRPHMSTFRFGVRLGFRVHTGTDGSVTGLTVAGSTGPYQIDPANGRVYFTGADEDRLVTIQYRGVVEATGEPSAWQTVQAPVLPIVERREAPIPIEQAVNESHVATFLDPFQAGSWRPNLIWMIWTSTRGGTPDLYFQGIAPRFTPVVTGGTSP
jgi:outer membrane protein assembly factor BamB